MQCYAVMQVFTICFHYGQQNLIFQNLAKGISRKLKNNLLNSKYSSFFQAEIVIKILRINFLNYLSFLAQSCLIFVFEKMTPYGIKLGYS